MQIFIPTRDRIDAQYTWDNLTDELRAQTFIVCPEEEVAAHEAKGRRVMARPPVKLAQVRQWLVETVSDPDTPVIMLDDDLGFFRRKDPDAYNLKPISGEPELNLLFQELHDLVAVHGYGHAGLSPRQGNNRMFPATLINSSRVNAVHCVLPRVLLENDARYDAVEMMEDYHVTLTLLEKGVDNAVITDGAWDQVKGSGAPGGFSHYRTKQRQAEAALKLFELHPDYVRVVEKEPKTGQGDNWSGTRVDVRVYWHRAFQHKPLTPQEDLPDPSGDYRPDHSYRKDRETRKWLEEEDLSAEGDDATQDETED